MVNLSDISRRVAEPLALLSNEVGGGGVVSIVQKFMEKIQDRLVIDCHIRNERGSQLSLTIQSTIDLKL